MVSEIVSSVPADGEQAGEVIGDRGPRLHRRGIEVVSDVASTGLKRGRVIFQEKELPDTGPIIDLIFGKTTRDGSAGKPDQ